jgi:cyanophycinase
MNLALFGSGEFTDDTNEIDEYLISEFSPKNIAVIPTAAGLESDVMKWIKMAEEHYSKFKIDVIPIPVLNKTQANDSKLVKLISPADWIFFSGGNPAYLLESLEKTILWSTVMKKYESGTLLSGSSAGAMIMGNFVMSPSSMNSDPSNEENWKDAFGLVNYTVIPHFDYFKKNNSFMKKMLDQSPDKVRKSWMGIDENTAIIYKAGERFVRGKGGVEINDSTGIYHLN